MKDQIGKQTTQHKANLTTHPIESFTFSLVALLNEFASYLQDRHGQGTTQNEEQNQLAAILSQFAGFLADANSKTSQGILLAFMIAFQIGSFHDLWVIDSGATDHMSNKLTNFFDFTIFSTPMFVSVANGKGAPVKGKGKIKLVSHNVKSDVLYVPSFPF